MCETCVKGDDMDMYHYLGCGLKNVFLKNGFTRENTPYGEGVSIKDLEGLHQAIALNIIQNKPELSGDELRFLRKELGFTQASLGAIVGKDAQTVALWEKGDNPVPSGPANMVRVIYTERIDGNAHLEKLINRINDLDREVHEHNLTLTDTENGWSAAA